MICEIFRTSMYKKDVENEKQQGALSDSTNFADRFLLKFTSIHFSRIEMIHMNQN